MTSATATPAVKRSHHKKPAAPTPAGKAEPGNKELFNKKEMGTPASQKTIDGKKDLKKTPPFEVMEAAEHLMEKKFEMNNGKQKYDDAYDLLLKRLKEHNMTQVSVKDHDGKRRRILVLDGEESLKIEKDNDSGSTYIPDED